VSPALLEFLRTSRRAALEQFRLAKQSEAANLRRELAALYDLLLAAETAVELASLFIDPPRARPALDVAAAGSALRVRSRDGRARLGGAFCRGNFP
jgi:hypothetical protein